MAVMKSAYPVILLGMTLLGDSLKAENKWDIDKLDLSKLPPVADKKGVTFANDIRPIFQTSCVRCHSSGKRRGDLRVDSLEGLLAGGKDGKVVVPGDS